MSETNNKGVKVLASASLLFVTIIWGSAFVVMKNSMDAITPTYLLAYRFTIAALGMAALFWKQIRECRCRSLNAAHWRDCFYLSVIIFRRMG